MRRMRLVVVVVAVMAALMMSLANPAMAAHRHHHHHGRAFNCNRFNNRFNRFNCNACFNNNVAQQALFDEGTFGGFGCNGNVIFVG